MAAPEFTRPRILVRPGSQSSGQWCTWSVHTCSSALRHVPGQYRLAALPYVTWLVSTDLQPTSHVFSGHIIKLMSITHLVSPYLQSSGQSHGHNRWKGSHTQDCHCALLCPECQQLCLKCQHQITSWFKGPLCGGPLNNDVIWSDTGHY